MNPIVLTAFLTVFSLTSAFANWVNLNTNINDNLNAIEFWQNNGVVVGDQGIYFTTNSGVSWTRFNILSNPSDSIKYNNSQFYGCASSATNTILACGRDSVNNNAIVFEFDVSTLAYNITYIGGIGSQLNAIDYNAYGYHVVGNDGLILKISGSTITTHSLSNPIDLYSIDFANNKVTIGGDGYRVYGTSDWSGVNLTAMPAVGDSYFGVAYVSNTEVLACGQSYYQSISNNPLIEHPNYNYGALNGRATENLNGIIFVGTDHGIFKAIPSSTYLEWQPSSANYSINDLSWNNGVYACGNNGVVLITMDYGGPTIPFMTLDVNGGCVNTNVLLTAHSGSSNSCEWYLNNTLISTNCGSITHFFDSLGLYEIMLIGSNGFYSDTVIQSMYVVEVPQEQLFSIDDSVICHSESIGVTVFNSEQFVSYSFLEVGSPIFYGSSPAGNGSTLNYSTSPIDHPGLFIIEANSTLAACSFEFQDTIQLFAEYTNADFHVGKINATPNEVIPYFENCNDAQNFEWTFSPGANIGSSSLENPTNSFNITGSTTIKLVCWSDLGCYDSITLNGTYIYPPLSTIDSCWVNDDDYSIVDYYNYYPTRKTAELGDGYGVCGFYEETFFSSQHGENKHLETSGGFLNKYNDDGSIRWSVYSKEGPYAAFGDTEDIASFTEDSQGNIYIVGNTWGYFFDNSGDSLGIGIISTGINSDVFYFAKLDSNGILQWVWSSAFFEGTDVAVDSSDNLIVSLTYTGGSNGAPSFFNNQYVGHLYNGAVSREAGILKLDPNGSIIWNVGFNDLSIKQLNLDGEDYIYGIGRVESTSIDYFPDNSATTSQISLATYGAAHLRLNQSGVPQWILPSRTFGGSSLVRFTDFVVDQNGDSYITGYNSCYVSGSAHRIYNSNGTFTATGGGQPFWAKVDSTGYCQWIRSAKYTNQGAAWCVALQGNELSILGHVGLVAPNNNVTFNSTNGTHLQLAIHQIDYFIARYDTSGNIIKVISNGSNPNVYAYGNHEFSGLFIKDSMYYTSRNVEIANPGTFDNFGTIMPSTGDLNSYVSKFTADCGIEHCSFYSTVKEDTICKWDSFTFEDGTTMNNITSDIYQTNLLYNIYQCDSFVNNSVHVYQVDTFLYQNNGTFSSYSQEASNFQWLNCSGGTPIPIQNATNSTFSPSANGSYALILEENGCVDTSQCITIDNVGIQPLPQDWQNIMIFPNPTQNSFTVKWSNPNVQMAIELFDLHGKRVLKVNADSISETPILINGDSGVYTLKVLEEGYPPRYFKVVKIN